MLSNLIQLDIKTLTARGLLQNLTPDTSVIIANVGNKTFYELIYSSSRTGSFVLWSVQLMRTAVICCLERHQYSAAFSNQNSQLYSAAGQTRAFVNFTVKFSEERDVFFKYWYQLKVLNIYLWIDIFNPFIRGILLTFWFFSLSEKVSQICICYYTLTIRSGYYIVSQDDKFGWKEEKL